MMSSRSSFILAYILTIFVCQSASSYTFIRKDDVTESCKIVPKCYDNGTKIDASNFTTIDLATGTVKVILQGRFEERLTLLSRLYGDPCPNSASVTLCPQEDGDTFKKLPSLKYSIYNCEMNQDNASSECSYQEVTFQYLFTSCYALYNNNSECLAYGYIETNYTNITLQEDCSLKTEVELIQEKYALISLNITPFLQNSVLKFVVTDDCMAEAKDDDFWWRVEVKEDQNENVITEKNEIQNRTVDCAIVLNEEIGLRQLRCELNWADKLCIMAQREKSNNPINFRSCPDVFYKDIGTLRPYGNTEYTFPAAYLSRTTNTLFLMFIPLTAVSVCVCLKLYFSDTHNSLFDVKGASHGVKKKILRALPTKQSAGEVSVEWKNEVSPEFLPFSNQPIQQSSGKEGSNSRINSPCEKCKVLLLYPQDCDYFMAIMKNLQNLLHSLNYFEVYDYFDPNRFGEIACDPQGWITELLSDKNVRIVLAETDTAVLHQLAVSKKCVVNYVSPLSYSNLFQYGLQNLLHSLRPQEYSRIFLIRFEDMTQHKENLKLSRYQRYKLPEHLRSLISCMSNCKEIKEPIEMENLKHSIKKFREFQQHNPTYHAEICNNLTKLI